MLCVEDILDALGWAEQAGGLPGLIARSAANLAAVESWVASSSWAGFLAEDEAIRSPTSICLSLVDPVFRAASPEARAAAAKKQAALDAAHGPASDIPTHHDHHHGLRV